MEKDSAGFTVRSTWQESEALNGPTRDQSIKSLLVPGYQDSLRQGMSFCRRKREVLHRVIDQRGEAALNRRGRHEVVSRSWALEGV